MKKFLGKSVVALVLPRSAIICGNTAMSQNCVHVLLKYSEHTYAVMRKIMLAATLSASPKDKRPSVIQFLILENVSGSEIHTRMCVTYGSQNNSKENFVVFFFFFENFTQFSREFLSIFKIISFNFKENLTKFLSEFHFLQEFQSIFKKISHNF